MVRNCPNCKNNLNLSSHYFCSYCGFQLTSDVVSIPNSILRTLHIDSASVKITKPSEEKESSAIKKMLTKIGLLILVVILFFVGISFISQKLGRASKISSPTSSSVSKPALPIAYTLNSSSEMASFRSDKFSKQNEAYYVPFDADIYIEGTDLPLLASLFSETAKDNVFYKFYSVNAKNFEPHFALYTKEKNGTNYWNFLLFPSSEMTQDSGLITKDFDTLHVSKIENAYLVTMDFAAEKESLSAKKGIEKNLALNPIYVSAMTGIPESGKIILMPLTEKGKKYLEVIEKEVLPEDIEELIEHLIKNKFPGISLL